ncbi:hypothetical protein Tco_0365005 [Tanacetum coccineum]
MKRVSRGYSGIDFALFPTMISAPETSPSRITSSPSLSPKTHTPVSTPSTSQPPNTQPIPDVEEAVQIPHESPLHSIHSLRRDEGSLSLNELTNLCTSLSNKVQKQLGVFSAATTLIDAAKRRTSVETAQTYTKRRRFVSNSSGRVSTASRTISTADVSTASELGSTAGVKAKDKGKAIMQESEPPKKVKKRVQVQMSMDEELAKKVFEEEKAKAMAEQEQERINFEAALELKKYEMLDDFDIQDVMDLHKLVEERYATSRPEGYDLMLWGDLKILFQPDKEDEVWRN